MQETERGEKQGETTVTVVVTNINKNHSTRHLVTNR